MNGFIQLKAFSGHYYTVLGGPFHMKPAGTVGVCLKEYGSELATIKVKWPDFGVPDPSQLIAALDATIDHMIAGQLIYVGCGAGIGRTGTFLACLAKLFGEKNPLQFIRSTYMQSAVETAKQEDFIEDIHFP